MTSDETVTMGITGKKPKVQLEGITLVSKPIKISSPAKMDYRQLRGETFLPYKAAITVGNNTDNPVKATVARFSMDSGG